ncbi:MAG: ABC transporter permease [Myxococcota bacterium]
MARPRWVLLGRELRRRSKRWQFVLLRVFPPLLFTLVVMAVIASTTITGPGNSVGTLGRALFRATVILATLYVSIILPVQFVSAAQEERETGTLELLSLTGIRPVQALWTHVGATGITTVLVMLGCLPILSIIPTLGGVSITQTVSAVVIIGSLGLTLAAIGVAMAVVTRRAALPMIAILGWMVLFLGILPALYGDALRRTSSMLTRTDANYLFPFVVLDKADSISLFGLIPWVSTVAVCAMVATWRFRKGLDSGWNPTIKAWPGWRLGWIPHAALQIGGWGWIQAMAAGGRAYTPTENLSSPTELIVAMGLGVVLLASGSLLYVRTLMWLLPRLGLSRTTFRIPVVGDPVLWRELLTKAGGGLNWGVWIATGAWLLIVLLFVALYGLDDDILIPGGLLAGLGALVLSVLVLVASINEDRRRRTLPLLLATTYSPARIVGFKVLAAALRVSPLVVMGTVAFVASQPKIFMNAAAPYGDTYLRPSSMGNLIFTWVPASRLLFGMTWTMGLWLTALSLAALLTIRLKSPAAAWSVPVLAGLGVPLSIPMIAVLGHQLLRYTALDDLAQDVVFPVASRSFTSGSPSGVSIELVVGGLFWWALGAALVVAAVRTLRRVGPSRR